MELLNRQDFAAHLKRARITRRLQRELRYVPEVITRAEVRDFLVVRTKSGSEGVLLYGDAIVPFTIDKRRPNAAGRVEAIICDICATWQRGTASAVLTLKKGATRTASYLVCADLDCSLHVRGLTDASVLSRTQLREQISPEGRVARLLERLRSIVALG